MFILLKKKNAFLGQFGSNFFWKNWPNPPGESKTRCGESGGINMSPIRANLTDFSNFFIFFTKVQKKWPKNETFFNFFPTPQPPGTLKPFPRAKARDGGVARQIFIPIGPNGASFMPI